MESYYLLFFLLLPLLFLFKFKSANFKSKYRLPPGPWRLPVVGSIHHLVGRGLPHHALRSLSQQYGGLMFLQLGELNSIVVSSKEAAREVMKTHDLTFCNRPVNPIIKLFSFDGKDVAFAPYGENWREMRKICVLELLSTKRVQSFGSVRDEEVQGLIQSIRLLSRTGLVFNLSEKLYHLANDVTLRSTMGKKTKEQDLFLRELQEVSEMGAQFDAGNLFPSSLLIRILTARTIRRAEEFRGNMDRILDNILRDHKANQVDGDVENLLTVLLRLQNEQSDVLTMDNIKGVLFDTLTAGTETTATTLTWAMAELIRNPRVMKKVQAELRHRLQGHDIVTMSHLDELHYMHLVIKETLRLHAPIPLLLPRECREACNILGYDIPKGTMVFVNAWALGRDSEYWKDAEEFRPERFEEESANLNLNGVDLEFIPFGAGRRICPGMTFGLATIDLALANLLYHFDWQLPSGITPEQLDMTETPGLTAKKKSPLILRALPYKY